MYRLDGRPPVLLFEIRYDTRERDREGERARGREGYR